MQKAVFILNNYQARSKQRPRHSAVVSRERIHGLMASNQSNKISMPTTTYMNPNYKKYITELGWLIKAQALRQKWKFMETGAIGINIRIQQIKSRGDTDNLIGFIYDAMNGVVFRDDSQITQQSCKLEMTLKNAIVVEIWAIEENETGQQEWAKHALGKQKGFMKLKSRKK